MSTLARASWALSLTSVVLLVAACGGGADATAPPSTTAAQGGSTGQGRFGQGGRPFPGASGLVAAVEGTTLQVQGNNTQTAVSYTSATRFTSQVTATSADVVVGSCVMVRNRVAGAPQPTQPTPSTQPVDATSVTITAAVDGKCTGGFGRGGGGGLRALPGGPPPGAAPRGSRTGRPTNGAIGGRAGGFGGAFGKVTAVSANGFTVASTVFERPTGAATGTPAPGSTPMVQTRVVRVTTSAGTTYTKTVAATAKAAAVGTCVTAEGKADDTGAVAATSIAVRPAENGSCGQGFGRRATPSGGTNG